jgi:hypothetical protein
MERIFCLAASAVTPSTITVPLFGDRLPHLALIPWNQGGVSFAGNAAKIKTRVSAEADNSELYG